MSPGVAYTIATGRLFCSFALLHSEAERLLGRPILTHEFADRETWAELRSRLEQELELEGLEDGGLVL